MEIINQSVSFNNDHHQHMNRLAQFLKMDFRDKKSLCDTRLCFKNGTVLAHSQILQCFSKSGRNFKGMDIDLMDFEGKTVYNLLKWVYNGSVDLELDTISKDLELISIFGLFQFQRDIESKLLEIAKNSNTVAIFNTVTKCLKIIPHSSSTILPVSDDFLIKIVDILHAQFVDRQISYREFLKLSRKTLIAMLSSKIGDVKKVDVINITLKWIYECRLSNDEVITILKTLTFNEMTFEMLVHFRNSLIQTAVPVTIGRCVRLRKFENNTFDIIFGKDEELSNGTKSEVFSTKSCSSEEYFSETTKRLASGSDSENETDFWTRIDDCTTACQISTSQMELHGLN